MTFDNHGIKPLLAVLAVAVAVLAAFAVVQAPAADEGEGPDWIHASIEKALAEAPEGAEFTGFYAVGYTDGEGAPLKVSDAEGRFLEDVSGKGPAGDDVTIISGGKWVFEGQSLVLQAGWDKVPGQCTLKFVLDGVTFTERAVVGGDAPVIGDAEDKDGNTLSDAISEKTGWYAIGVKLQNTYVADATLAWTSEDLVQDGLWAVDKDMRFTVETSNAYTVVLWDNGIHVANVEARYGEPFSIPSEHMSGNPLFTGYATAGGDVVVTFEGTTVPGVEGVTDGDGCWASAANVDLYVTLAGSGSSGGSSGGSPGGVVYTAAVDDGNATLTGAYKADSPSDFYTGDLVISEYVKQVEGSSDPVLYAPAEAGDGGAVLVTGLRFIDDGEDSTLRATSATTPSSVTSIGDKAFYYCDSLESVDMPYATSIGEYALFYCTSLKSVSMPLVTSIDIYAFYNCGSLESVPMPSVTSIGYYAFESCGSLESVDMPSVTSIGYNVFSCCGSLESVSMPNVTSVSESAFEECPALASVTMTKAESVGDRAFYNCTSLESAPMPNVTSVGYFAFYGASMTSVSMPLVTSVDDYAFYYCESLESVDMPKATYIGDFSFRGCAALSEVVFGAASVTTSEDSFPGSGLNETTVAAGTYVLMEGAWVKQP